mgnify:CR=1 FL=1
MIAVTDAGPLIVLAKLWIHPALCERVRREVLGEG